MYSYQQMKCLIQFDYAWAIAQLNRNHNIFANASKYKITRKIHCLDKRRSHKIEGLYLLRLL